MRALPPGLRYPVGARGGTAWYAVSPGQRRNALVNYGAVLGRSPHDPEVAAVARKAFENYGRMLMDFLLLGSLSSEELSEHVTVGGNEHADAALATGRGCIMALPHMGSWDLAGSYAAVLGYPLAAIAERFPGSLDEAVVAARSRFGLRVIPLARSAVGSIRRELEAGRMVALLCDLPPPGGGGVEVSFFGRRAVVPGGPAAFACRTGARIVPAACWGTGPGRYHIQLAPALEPDEVICSGRPAGAGLMQRLISVLERFIAEHPADWYAFKPLFGEPAGVVS